MSIKEHLGDVMKKLITTVLFSMLLIFLAACGNETDTTENITENKTVEEVSTLENGEFTKVTKTRKTLLLTILLFPISSS